MKTTHPANGPSKPQPGSYVGPGKVDGAGEHMAPGAGPGPAARRKMGMQERTADAPSPRGNPKGMSTRQAPY